ncbi:DNA-formamidopyrimidine glycosylase family protein [Mucilaginibacter sp. cycad4]|uniref:DNA-formamidopyrimidine glycosylase family protein n=1 Tax=Mucilaginibacter sp. cycad4 TaxID=3342096 RepID=UPI002AAC1C1B|nr:DNA-formamidopyrimidine glycosylase family protein [Mucilaginibacter gossypii]WPU99192.1 DNA-formamidopyrimidine glycosylase family protein [Mucilaginibacter gossypii]
MPEIPDLNIFSSNLTKKLVGKTLSLVDILITRQLKVPAADIKTALEGQLLNKINRIGKELRFEFQNGRVLSIHLMLHGTMFWFEGKNENRFTIAELLFDDGTGLAITDWQKAVILTLDPKPATAPDALAIPPGYLHSALSKLSKPIKTVLTEGKTVQGIGNAYVDEILYAARISPFSKANKIPEMNIDILVEAINTVLVDAENHIRQNFPDTITEKERDFLQVHRPKQTLTLNGEVILKAELDKRKTYYVESQQFFE